MTKTLALEAELNILYAHGEKLAGEKCTSKREMPPGKLLVRKVGRKVVLGTL